MVMTKGGNVDPTSPRSNVVNHHPFQAPSTTGPDNDQRIDEAAVSDGVRGGPTPAGSASHGAWDASANGCGTPTKPGAAPPKIGKLA
jgi:hypothetical protein